MSRRVIVISNDVVPGQAMPVAAPGLRAFGLASGLRQHGFDVSVITIAHLSDAQRMFFVTLLLVELIAWMRRQQGTASLRAVVSSCSSSLLYARRVVAPTRGSSAVPYASSERS